jgi:phosphate transport system substrate-binding protein
VRILASTLAAAFVGSAAPGAAPVQERAVLRYGGSSTIAQTVLQAGVGKAYEERTGVRVKILDVTGTGRGLDELAAGKLDICGVGRPLTPDERKAGLVGTPIAHDALAVYVHRTNPIRDLTRAQLRDVLSGRIQSWKQLGGRDVRIVPVVEPVASKRATIELVLERIMGGVAIAPDARQLELLTDHLAEVARTEGAVAVASVGYLAIVEPGIRDGVRPISLDGLAPTDQNIRSGAYLLARPMLLATRGSPAGEAKALLDFILSREGQAVVERYFVPVLPVASR